MSRELLDDGALARHFDEEEKREILLLQAELKDKDHKVRFGIYALYAVAALNFLTVGLLFIWHQTSGLLFWLNLIEGVLFWVLSWVARRYPQWAFITAMLVYMTMVVIYAYYDPESLIRGVLWKLAVVIFLLRALANAFDRKKILQRLSDLGVRDPYDQLI